jgi:hypothetical protein
VATIRRALVLTSIAYIGVVAILMSWLLKGRADPDALWLIVPPAIFATYIVSKMHQQLYDQQRQIGILQELLRNAMANNGTDQKETATSD